MADKTYYFDKLDKLHSELNNYIAPVSRDCGPCINCCINISESHLFVPLYIDYINYNLGENNSYVKTWEEGIEIPLCPYIDLTAKKCAIYQWRPLSCRLYPMMLERSENSMYYRCVFYNLYEKDFSDLESLLPPGYKHEIDKIIREISKLNVQYIREFDSLRLEQYKKSYETPVSKEVRLFKALNIYREALNKVPESVCLKTQVAKIYMELKDYDSALNMIDHILEIDKKECMAKILKAKIYLIRNRISDGISEIKEVININSSITQAHYMLGVMCLLDEKPGEAFEAFQSLLNINHLARYRYKDLGKFMSMCNGL
ncbi:MAG: YkgJ family cysteine cluster protein [Candidatus Eremiobacterota bacterium]